LPLPSNDSKSFCVDIIYEEYLFESNKKISESLVFSIEFKERLSQGSQGGVISGLRGFLNGPPINLDFHLKTMS
jgi:hypothetical protein